jgi:hypothetical protein
MLSALPARPTVTPLNVRSPDAAMLNSPSTRPRSASGAWIWTRAWLMLLNESSKNPARNSNGNAR